MSTATDYDRLLLNGQPLPGALSPARVVEEWQRRNPRYEVLRVEVLAAEIRVHVIEVPRIGPIESTVTVR